MSLGIAVGAEVLETARRGATETATTMRVDVAPDGACLVRRLRCADGTKFDTFVE